MEGASPTLVFTDASKDNNDDLNLRKIALDYAFRGPMNITPEEILRVADKFYNFLKSGTTPSGVVTTLEVKK